MLLVTTLCVAVACNQNTPVTPNEQEQPNSHSHSLINSNQNLFTSKQGYPATCAKEGYTDEISCSKCGKILQTQEPIEALHVQYTLNNGTYEVIGLNSSCTDKHITIPSTYLGKNVTAIGSGVGTSFYDPLLDGFARCFDIESVTLPEGLKEIRLGAFAYCESLKTINIPSTCVYVGQYAFAYSDILEIEIPASVRTLGTFFVMGCTKITKIVTPFGIDKIFGEVFFRATNSSIPSSLKEVIFTAGTDMHASAFNGCKYINKIVLPDTLTSIGDRAFMDCTNLASIELGNNIDSIGDSAFSGCSSFRDVYYKGSSKEWAKINISSNNTYLKNANIHYLWNSEDKIYCNTCNGTGSVSVKETCSTCSGTGNITSTRTCSTCSGYGWSSAYARCSCGNLSGNVTPNTQVKLCTRCGTTMNIVSINSCSSCSGTGRIQSHISCSTCLGTGQRTVIKDCTDCNGFGYISTSSQNSASNHVRLIAKNYKRKESNGL